MLKKLTNANKTRDGLYHEEFQYLELISDILKEGEIVNGRNGLTKTIFGSAMHFSLENNTIPILTTKKVAWKTCLRELLWFIKGSTSNLELQSKNGKDLERKCLKGFLRFKRVTTFKGK